MSSPDNDYKNESRENKEFLQSQEIKDLCNASTIVNISIQKKDRKKAKVEHEEVQDKEIKYEEANQKVVSFFFFFLTFQGLVYNIFYKNSNFKVCLFTHVLILYFKPTCILRLKYKHFYNLMRRTNLNPD